MAQEMNEIERLKWERSTQARQVRAQVLSDGSKGLMLINGGGAAALAAFLQAIWETSSAAPMRAWILIGMMILILGTAAAASVFLTRYFGSLHKNTTKPKKNPWWWAQMILTAVSIICFLAGMSAAVVGAFCAL